MSSSVTIMNQVTRLRSLLIFVCLLIACCSAHAQSVLVGADRIDLITGLVGQRRVGITGNQTSILSDKQHTHLLDTLIACGVRVAKLYSPEHGFRGDADAGATVRSGHDSRTDLPIISLYGRNKKPTPTHLSGIEVMLFDLQDVGVRFYTYISTLKYIMEACADAGIPVIVLDRPNPHDTVDGPVLKDKKYKSFISLLPIPAVHGMTMGEIAQMLVGERWLETTGDPALTVVTTQGWVHGQTYDLPIPPSPNLRSAASIRMYPTLCYFEPTTWSVGRGTDAPFEQIGYPDKRLGRHTFTPVSMIGATAPKHKGQKCYGPSLTADDFELGINLDIIIRAARISRKSSVRFIDRPATFNLLAGNGELRHQIQNEWSAEKIRATWHEDLENFRVLRRKYLLYPDDRNL